MKSLYYANSYAGIKCWHFSPIAAAGGVGRCFRDAEEVEKKALLISFETAAAEILLFSGPSLHSMLFIHPVYFGQNHICLP